MTEKKIVKNTSKAGSGNYGYNYASLADIAEQGFEIPKMRIKPIFSPNGDFIADYVEFFDGTEWQLGSRVIEAELKGMNPMQSRGSAETYARRYTTLMALALAGQDDKKVEDDGIARRAERGGFRVDFNSIRETVNAIDDIESLKSYYEELQAKNPTPGQLKTINEIINKAKARLTER